LIGCPNDLPIRKYDRDRFAFVVGDSAYAIDNKTQHRSFKNPSLRIHFDRFVIGAIPMSYGNS
jgi:hypothetical protein